MNFIKNFFSKNIFLKTGIAAAVFTALVCFVCFAKYTVKAKAEKSLEEEGAELFSEDLSEDYYRELNTRFLNRNGETYEHYRMMEGVAVSFYGDGGIIDETNGG
ncbi:MAG: hypothetical protein LUH47_02280 [Clostridiales bacterium]|nr:hypothetical protein [Clostridiales bacterium]